MSEAYTDPELNTERRIAGRVRAKILRAGGCPYCVHAVHGWNRSACDTPGRTFPLCLKTPGVAFEPDNEKLENSR